MEPSLQNKIDKAVATLLRAGALRVYVFGSASEKHPEAAAADARQPADIDIAVEGLPRDALFRVVGDLLYELGIPVDVIDLDRPSPFVRRLRESGRLRRVA